MPLVAFLDNFFYKKNTLTKWPHTFLGLTREYWLLSYGILSHFYGVWRTDIHKTDIQRDIYP